MDQKIKGAALFKDNFQNFCFVLPAFAIFCIFYIYPFYKMIHLSFYDWRGIGPMHFIGFANYKELMGDKLWWDAIWHAGYITLIALVFQNPLAFALAMACDREINLKRFYRVVFFIPPVLSQLVVGFIWNWMLNPEMQNGQYSGLLNHFLFASGFPQLVHDWLGDPKTALTTIAIVNCWQGFGWGFVIFLAGLQTIDKQLYEAARIDGASAWKTFTNITIPMMLPVILVVVILTILGCMQIFVLILAMVNEGLVHHTDVPVTRIFSAMQNTNRFGYACCEVVNFGMILVGVSILSKKLSDKVKQA